MFSLSATPDQISSIASYIAREWGDYGYRITALESPTYAVTVATVRHSDGSEFKVMGDRYGNCQPLSEDKTLEVADILAFHAHAVAV